MLLIPRIQFQSDLSYKHPKHMGCRGFNCLCPPASDVVAGCLGVISEAEDHSVWYAFPSGVDFPKCHREIAASLNDFSGNWCGRENVEPDALKELTINIFGIIDIHALFLLALYTFLPPGP